MSGQPDATAVSHDTHPWALEHEPEPSVVPRLMRGAIPCCDTCGRPLEPGEPRVTVADPNRPKAPWLRCGDCEYRSARA